MTQLLLMDEICELLGLSRSAIYKRTHRIAMPGHVQKLGRSKLWSIDDIEEWAEKFAALDEAEMVNIDIDDAVLHKHNEFSSRLLERHWCEIDDAFRFLRAPHG